MLCNFAKQETGDMAKNQPVIRSKAVINAISLTKIPEQSRHGVPAANSIAGKCSRLGSGKMLLINLLSSRNVNSSYSNRRQKIGNLVAK